MPILVALRPVSARMIKYIIPLFYSFTVQHVKMYTRHLIVRTSPEISGKAESKLPRSSLFHLVPG